jgi:hypothetical protein
VIGFGDESNRLIRMPLIEDVWLTMLDVEPCSARRTLCFRIDFFAVEVLTWQGLVTYYVLFFIHLESRRVCLAGITRHTDEAWMEQMGRNATVESWGNLERRRYALHDRDTKFCDSFRATLRSGGIRPIQLPESESERLRGDGCAR